MPALPYTVFGEIPHGTECRIFTVGSMAFVLKM